MVLLGILLHWLKACTVSVLRSSPWSCLLSQRKKGFPSRQGDFKFLCEQLTPKNHTNVAVTRTEHSPYFEIPSIPKWGKISASFLARGLVKSGLNSLTGEETQLYSAEQQRHLWVGSGVLRPSSADGSQHLQQAKMKIARAKSSLILFIVLLKMLTNYVKNQMPKVK